MISSKIYDFLTINSKITIYVQLWVLITRFFCTQNDRLDYTQMY